jgi:hypothetical protein
MEINNQAIKKETNEKEMDEAKKIDNEDKVKESFFRKLYNELKVGVNKNYKTLILITIVSLIIIYLNIPQKLYTNVMVGGDNENSSKSSGSNENKEKKKASFADKYSPLSGGINVMYWLAKNIILLYLFLIFLTLIPSVPIILYITVFYFIMSGLLGRITDI